MNVRELAGILDGIARTSPTAEVSIQDGMVCRVIRAVSVPTRMQIVMGATVVLHPGELADPAAPSGDSHAPSPK